MLIISIDFIMIFKERKERRNERRVCLQGSQPTSST